MIVRLVLGAGEVTGDVGGDTGSLFPRIPIWMVLSWDREDTPCAPLCR